MNGEPVLRLLRAWLAGACPLPSLPLGVTDVARAHRLTGALYHIGAPVDEVDARFIETDWIANAAAHLRRLTVLAEVWPRDLPAPLVFKGADIAEHLFQDPGARRCSDVDLLLPDPFFEPASAALVAAGGEASTPRAERFRGEGPHERAFRFGEVTLELHRSPSPPHRARLSGHAVWSRGEPARLGDTPVRRPTPIDRVLLWAANQAKQSFAGDLCDLLDLALILRALPAPTPWTALHRAAVDAGLTHPVAIGLQRLRRAALWPGPLPAIGHASDRLVAALLPAAADPPSPHNAFVFQALKLWLADPPARRAIAARLLATAARRAREPTTRSRERR